MDSSRSKFVSTVLVLVIFACFVLPHAVGIRSCEFSSDCHNECKVGKPTCFGGRCLCIGSSPEENLAKSTEYGRKFATIENRKDWGSKE